MKYGELNLGQIEAIVNKLGGMEGVQRFLSGELMVKAAERAFSVWKTIEIGVHKTSSAYEGTLEANSFRIGDYARKILKKILVSQTEVELDLVVVTPAELGLKNPTYQQICDRAVELGLEKCPREVGPALRLAYLDQPYGEWLRIAMEPEGGSGGVLRVFDVEHDDLGVWLRTRWFDPQSTWRGDFRFVFVCPRK